MKKSINEKIIAKRKNVTVKALITKVKKDIETIKEYKAKKDKVKKKEINKKRRQKWTKNKSLINIK